MSSREELRLEGCEAVGDSNEVTGKGDKGKGLKGEAAAATAAPKGEWVQAYGDGTSVGGVGNPEVVVAMALALDELKALAMAAMATAATALPEPCGTGMSGGGGRGNCVKAWLPPPPVEVAEDGVRLSEELVCPKAVTKGLLGAVCRPPLQMVLVVRSTGVSRMASTGPALFGDLLLWNALLRPDSTKCLKNKASNRCERWFYQ